MARIGLHAGQTFDAAAAQFTIDISAESLARTSGLGALGPINLEKALRAHDRLGGHIVSGHVDGIGHVSYFAELIDEWAQENDPNETLFRLGTSVVEALAAGVDVEPLARYFEYWLLRLQGNSEP